MTDSLTAQALIKNLRDLNPTIDTNDPIIKDLVVNFGSQVVTDVQTRVAYLNSRYTNAFLNQLNDVELDIYAYNSQGLVRGKGTPVTGYVYFMISNLNGALNIASNTVVCTSDGVWKFLTTEPIYISPENIAAFFNPVRNAYEVRVPVKAVKPGTDYQVAAYRINTIQSTLAVNARVENREPFTSGADPESREDFINRLNLSKLGFNLNTASGLRESVISHIQGLNDIQIEHETGQRNSYQAFYIGYQPVAEVLEYKVTNPNNRDINFERIKTPVRYVDAIVVDGVTISPNLYRSTPTKVILHSSISLTSSSIIFVSYQYNKLNSALIDYLENTLDFPGSTWKIKEAVPDFIKLAVKVKPQNHLTLSEVSSLVSDTVYQYLNPNKFIVGIQASKVRNLLLDTHTYLLNCEVTINDKPFLNFDVGHYPVLTSDNLSIVLM